VDVEFAAWEKNDELPTMTANFGGITQTIAQTDADKLLLIPSVWDMDMGEPARPQLRTLSAIIQAAQANKKIKAIILATPYPSFEDNPIEDEITKGIKQQLKRDFGIEKILDLNAFIKQKPDWKNRYREKMSSSAIYTPFPIHLMDEICQEILELL